MDFINTFLDVIAALCVVGIYFTALYITKTKSRRAILLGILNPVVSASLIGIVSHYVGQIFW